MASTPSSADVDQVRDLNALMAWLRTFPRIEEQYDECQDVLRLLDDKEVATAILFCADEVCDVTKACESCKKDTETIWMTVLDIISTKMPQVLPQTSRTRVTTSGMRTFLLSALLCFAVSEHCPHQATYITRIMGLPSHCQEVLRGIIKKGQAVAETPKSRRGKETPKKKSGSKRNLNETSRSDDDEALDTLECSAKRPSSGDKSVGLAVNDSFASPLVFPGHTPQHKGGGRRLSVESLFSPNTIDSSLENLVSDLRTQNETLAQELATSQQREAELVQKMEESVVSFRKEMLKLESTSLQREEEVREAHKQEMNRMRQELDDTKAALETEQRASQQLESVRDDMDLLAHTKKQLAETEEKLRVCRERMEQLGDVKEALSREEQAHAARVEECLRLENEIHSLQPLRRQLEDYKTRAVECEVKLAECQEDLKRMERVTGNLNSTQKEILDGAKVHREEAEELRHRLLDEESASQEGPGVGEGLSELNPSLMVEMARLRNENIQLKAFAAAREDDAVQMLGERLDDSERLSDRYKEQFLSTKNELEQTEQKLQESQEHVATLNGQVHDLTSRLEELGQELDECKTQLSKSQSDYSHTSQLLEESKGREESLRGDVEHLSKQVSEANDLAAHRLEQLESTKTELVETAACLKETREEEHRLQGEVDDWNEKTAAAEAAFLTCEDQLTRTKRSLEETSASLEAALDREARLKEAVVDLKTTNGELVEKIDEGARSTEAALLAAETELNETRCRLEEKAKTELEEVKETMNTLLDTERTAFEEKLTTALNIYSKLKEQCARDLAQLEEKYTHDLQQANDENRLTQDQLKQTYEKEIAAVQQAAVEERETLIKKGKAMLKEAKERAKEELAHAENQLQSVELELAEISEKYEVYEKKTQKQLANYKKKHGIATSRIAELSQSNDTLEDTVKDLERERFKMQEENERFRRQLGGRFGADGKVQNQLETLRNEFDAMLEENRELKKKVEKMGDSNAHFGLSSVSESGEAGSGISSYTRGGASGSTLTQLRKEYEETIEQLKDQKRELVMRNSAAITDVQKAEQRAWESDKQVQELKEELTSMKLKLQRLQQDSDDYYDALSGSFQDDIKENPRANGAPILDLSMPEAAAQSTATKFSSSTDKLLSPQKILLDLSHSEDHSMPLTESTNENRDEKGAAFQTSATVTSKAKVSAYEFPSAQEMKKRSSPVIKSKQAGKSAPSLMDYAMSSQEDAQPECKQS